MDNDKAQKTNDKYLDKYGTDKVSSRKQARALRKVDKTLYKATSAALRNERLKTQENTDIALRLYGQKQKGVVRRKIRHANDPKDFIIHCLAPDMTDAQAFIMHHGVLGMKWGVRRAVGRAVTKVKKAAAKKFDERREEKRAKKLDKYIDKHYKNPAKVSQKQLNDRVKRLETQQKLEKFTGKSNKKKSLLDRVESFNKTIDTVDKTTSNIRKVQNLVSGKKKKKKLN